MFCCVDSLRDRTVRETTDVRETESTPAPGSVSFGILFPAEHFLTGSTTSERSIRYAVNFTCPAFESYDVNDATEEKSLLGPIDL